MDPLFETAQLNTVGPYWRGRYWPPLVVGLALACPSTAWTDHCARARGLGVAGGGASWLALVDAASDRR